MSNLVPEAAVIPVMLGTAGHVDHGKTSLVRCLTDFDTDRLPEEKRRGMSIDFAVAPFKVGGATAGIIDVPGHEDYLRNMVAGASAVDLVLLIVAADDGVMQQTLEHAAILHTLGVRSFILVITKCDLVPLDQEKLAADEAKEMLGALGVVPLAEFHVSSETGEGVAELRADLESRVASFERAPDLRAFRMPVRAVFSIQGFGTVVTGVPTDGSVTAGDTLELLPRGDSVVIRGIQNYRSESPTTSAHISSALNIREHLGAKAGRGMVLAEPGVYQAVESALVLIHNGPQSSALRRRGLLRAHTGTYSSGCSFRLIDTTELTAGGEAFAYVRFSTPAVLCAGDRLLLRAASASDVYAGGTVVGTGVGRMRALTANLLERFVSARAALDTGDLLRAELHSQGRMLLGSDDLVRLSRLPRTAREELLGRLRTAPDLREVSPGAWLFLPRIGELREHSKRLLAKYHRANPYSWGMKPQHVAETLGAPADAFPALREILCEDSSVVFRNGRLALDGFEPKISAREIKLREQVLKIITHAGIKSIARGELRAEVEATETELRLILRLLIEEGMVSALGKNLVTREIYDQGRAVLLDLFTKAPIVELAVFREATGFSRNLATMILESFDSAGLTKRVPEGRILSKRKS